MTEKAQYLVSSYWRSSMNIGNMRVFDNFSDATAYALTLDPDDDNCGQFSTFTRVYEIFQDKPPVQIRKYC